MKDLRKKLLEAKVIFEGKVRRLKKQNNRLDDDLITSFENLIADLDLAQMHIAAFILDYGNKWVPFEKFDKADKELGQTIGHILHNFNKLRNAANNQE